MDGPVLKTAAEGVPHGDIGCDAVTHEEEGQDVDDPWCIADQGNIATDHGSLSDAQCLGPAVPGAEGVEDDGAEDEAKGLTDEYERDDTVFNVVVSL